MPSTLASALDAARVRAFVGRESELEAFDSAISGRGTQRVLFVHGPGGIGKTTLLHQLRIRAVQQNRSVVELDARDIDCSPDSFRSAYELAGGGRDGRP
jgi:ABC-type lipoprotein export system ATPase subunit